MVLCCAWLRAAPHGREHVLVQGTGATPVPELRAGEGNHAVPPPAWQADAMERPLAIATVHTGGLQEAGAVFYILRGV